MSTTASQRRSLSRSPITASPASAPASASASASDRQPLSQKGRKQQQRPHPPPPQYPRRPFSEALSHHHLPQDDDDNSPGNDHHQDVDDDDDEAAVAVAVLVRGNGGGFDYNDGPDNALDDSVAALSEWGRFYDDHCTYLPAVRFVAWAAISRFFLSNHSHSCFDPSTVGTVVRARRCAQLLLLHLLS